MISNINCTINVRIGHFDDVFVLKSKDQKCCIFWSRWSLIIKWICVKNKYEKVFSNICWIYMNRMCTVFGHIFRHTIGRLNQDFGTKFIGKFSWFLLKENGHLSKKKKLMSVCKMVEEFFFCISLKFLVTTISVYRQLCLVLFLSICWCSIQIDIFQGAVTDIYDDGVLIQFEDGWVKFCCYYFHRNGTEQLNCLTIFSCFTNIFYSSI